MKHYLIETAHDKHNLTLSLILISCLRLLSYISSYEITTGEPSGHNNTLSQKKTI